MWIKPVWEFFLFDKVGKKSAALLKLTQTARKFFLLANSGREKLFVKKKCIIYTFFHVMQYFLPYGCNGGREQPTFTVSETEALV